jgi:hypothetical protein
VASRPNGKHRGYYGLDTAVQLRPQLPTVELGGSGSPVQQQQQDLAPVDREKKGRV